MSYLTTQYLVHENLLRAFFSNATLEQADEDDKDSCKVVAINTFLIGVPIKVTQGVVAQTFDMPVDTFCGYFVYILLIYRNC